jgi:hypothetical protein
MICHSGSVAVSRKLAAQTQPLMPMALAPLSLNAAAGEFDLPGARRGRFAAGIRKQTERPSRSIPTSPREPRSTSCRGYSMPRWPRGAIIQRGRAKVADWRIVGCVIQDRAKLRERTVSRQLAGIFARLLAWLAALPLRSAERLLSPPPLLHEGHTASCSGGSASGAAVVWKA